MIPRKKIKSFQDLYPTPGKQYGIATRHEADFTVRVLPVTFYASLPPLLTTLVVALDAYTGFQTKTDIANHSILFLIFYILAGLFSVVALVRLRSVLRGNVVNLGFLELMYLLAFLPACLAIGNMLVTSATAMYGLPPLAIAAGATVVAMFLFALVVRVTNR